MSTIEQLKRAFRPAAIIASPAASAIVYWVACWGADPRRCQGLAQADTDFSSTSGARHFDRGLGKPSSEAAKKELPYLRMSLATNASLHLVQLPLHLQGQLELTPARAFVSFGGGLVYAGAAALTFTQSRTLQQAGIYTFMGSSVIGAGFVGYGLWGCVASGESGCAVQHFNALNALILANQLVSWTLGVRQLTASRAPTVAALSRRLFMVSRPDGFVLRASGMFSATLASGTNADHFLYVNFVSTANGRKSA